MQRRKGFCVRCQTEVEFSPSGRYWERERMRPHWCEDPTPLATEHECLGCGAMVRYERLGDPKLDPRTGEPHECGTAGAPRAETLTEVAPAPQPAPWSAAPDEWSLEL